MLFLYVANMLFSVYLGAHWQALSMLFLGNWYNRLGGADCSCVEKDFINAGGYISFISGAFSIAANHKDSGVGFGPRSCAVVLFIGLIIFTTVHTQDFVDIEGDAA